MSCLLPDVMVGIATNEESEWARLVPLLYRLPSTDSGTGEAARSSGAYSA
jgi:hypothetical protein